MKKYTFFRIFVIVMMFITSLSSASAAINCPPQNYSIFSLTVLLSIIYLALIYYFNSNPAISVTKLYSALILLRSFFIGIMILYFYTYLSVSCDSSNFNRLLLISIAAFFIVLTFLFDASLRDKIHAQRILRGPDLSIPLSHKLSNWFKRVEHNKNRQIELFKKEQRRRHIIAAYDQKRKIHEEQLARKKEYLDNLRKQRSIEEKERLRNKQNNLQLKKYHNLRAGWLKTFAHDFRIILKSIGIYSTSKECKQKIESAKEASKKMTEQSKEKLAGMNKLRRKLAKSKVDFKKTISN